jgi:hypothetical protein
MCLSECVKVDFEPDMVSDIYKLNHPATLEEVLGIADRKHVGVGEWFKGSFDNILFICGYVGYRTGAGVVRISDTTHSNWLILETLIRREVIERLSQWVSTYDTDIEWRRGVRLGRFNPDELAKVKQVSWFDRVFRHVVLSEGTCAEVWKYEGTKCEEANAWNHRRALGPVTLAIAAVRRQDSSWDPASNTHGVSFQNDELERIFGGKSSRWMWI